MSVHKKLMEARILLQAVKMKKSGINKFAGYEYFELSDFIPHVQRIFNDLGLCGVVSYDVDLAKLTITDTADATQQIIITSPMESANLKGCHPIQNLGAVETYQRRYLWVTAMEILEHDALDSSNPKDNDEKKKEVETLPEYPDAQFRANSGAWKIAVQTKKQTPEHLINMISTKYTLTDIQKQSILNIGLENANIS